MNACSCLTLILACIVYWQDREIRDRMELTRARWRLVEAAAVLKLPLQPVTILMRAGTPTKRGAAARSHAQRCADRVVLPDSTPPRHPFHHAFGRVRSRLPSAASRSSQRPQKPLFGVDEEEPHPNDNPQQHDTSCHD